MIRKVFLDFIFQKIRDRKAAWLLKRALQYAGIQIGYRLKKPVCGPVLGTLFVTYACNYRCRMCNFSEKYEVYKKAGMKELPTEGLKKILDDMAALGVAGVGFTGGEPLLRPDIFELLGHSKNRNMITHLNSNGFFLNEEKIAKLLSVECDSLNISLDGSTATTHDENRFFPGAFDRVISALDILAREQKNFAFKMRVKIVAVVSEKNIDEIQTLFELAKILPVNCIELIPVQPFFKTRQKVDSNFLKKLGFSIEWLNKFRPMNVGIENSEKHLQLFKWSFQQKKSPVRCFAGYNSIGVDVYGQIFPCMPWINWGKTIGSCQENSLKEFWYSEKCDSARREVFSCRDCYLNCQAELNLLFQPLFRVPYL